MNQHTSQTGLDPAGHIARLVEIAPMPRRKDSPPGDETYLQMPLTFDHDGGGNDQMQRQWSIGTKQTKKAL